MKACWMVLLPNRALLAMVGAQINRDEALTCARIIWPEADVA